MCGFPTIWFLLKDNIALFTANVAQQTIVFSWCFHQVQLHRCVSCGLHRVLPSEEPLLNLMLCYHCLETLGTKSPHFHFALGLPTIHQALAPTERCSPRVLLRRATEKLSTAAKPLICILKLM